MRFVFFLAPILSAVFSLSDTYGSIEVHRERSRKASTWVRTVEGNQIHLDEIGVDEQGWPTLLSHETFLNRAEADRATRRSGFFGAPSAELFVKAESEARELRDAPKAVLWEVRNEWSFDWELKYGEWVEKSIDRDFFVNSNQPSDCADLVYVSRWIFARENGLPVANRLAGTGDYYTERSVKKDWLNLPTDPDWKKDRRFRAALNYLLKLTYTHSLLADSFPIAINPETFRAGIHHLSLFEESGHTLLVHRTDLETPKTIPFIVLSSTLPVAVRSLSEDPYFYSEQPKSETGGFLRMRWPVFTSRGVSLRAGPEMPNYSLEQYAPEFMGGKASFGIAVMQKLKPSFGLVAALQAGLDGIKKLFRDRVEIVEEGYAACSKILGGCKPNSMDYENWSTPSRDGRILSQMKLLGFLTFLGNSDEVKQMIKVFSEALEEPLIELSGEPITLGLLRETFQRGLYSSNPNLPVALRWGVLPEAVAEIFKNGFIDNFKSRQEGVASLGNTCLGNSSTECAPGGALYEKENRFELDRKLKLPEVNADAYCKATGTQDSKCLRLRALLDSTLVSLGEKTQSLSNWFETFLTYNSDPRVSRARSEGQEDLPYAKLEITGSRRFLKHGNLALRIDRKTRLATLFERDGITLNPLVFKNEIRLLDADLEKKQGLFAQAGNLLIGDLTGASEIKIGTIGSKITEARLLGIASNGNERVIGMSETEWAVFEKNPAGAWSEITRNTFKTIFPIDPKIENEVLLYLSEKDTPEWNLVDLRAESIQSVSFHGTPSATDERQNYVLKNSIYLQITETSPEGKDILRTIRLDRKTGVLALAFGIQGFVAHVRNDDRFVYFSDQGETREFFYGAPLDEAGNLGERTRISDSFYRHEDFVLFYGGPESMSPWAIDQDGALIPITLEPDEVWFKHVRGELVLLLLKNGNIGIRKVSGGPILAQDGFLSLPLAGTEEDPLRFLIRHEKDPSPTTLIPPSSSVFSDSKHPERFSILTGMLLGDPLTSPHEPWSGDTYSGVDSIQIDTGTVINLGTRVFWLGD